MYCQCPNCGKYFEADSEGIWGYCPICEEDNIELLDILEDEEE